jgi:hypothetical protein
MQWTTDLEFRQPNPVTNCVIGAYTTAFARLKLFEVLHKLGDKVLYFDTDSIIFVERPGEWTPTLGSYLGDLTDELAGNDIETFVTAGPKNYAYKLRLPAKNQTCCKVKGFTLDHRTSKKINFESMVELVTTGANSEVSVEYPHRLVRTRHEGIFTKAQHKTYRLVYNKRVIQDDYTTIPYGY